MIGVITISHLCSLVEENHVSEINQVKVHETVSLPFNSGHVFQKISATVGDSGTKTDSNSSSISRELDRTDKTVPSVCCQYPKKEISFSITCNMYQSFNISYHVHAFAHQ